MIKKTIYLALLAIPLFIMAKLPEKSSSGAPAGHTGAPGEASCATIGCHDDNATNSGKALLEIDLGGATHFVAGQTYPIKVRISETSIDRFGFQIVALANKDNSNAGKFNITDAARTQTVFGEYLFKDREYVTYTYNGTDAVSTGLGEWTLNWKAPSTSTGSVTFYASGVSANDDESDQGDFVFTTSKAFQPFIKVTESQK